MISETSGAARCILIAVTFMTSAIAVTAQPIVNATARPAPNGRGWFNGPVWIRFDCYRTNGCPATQVILTEGRGQRVTGAAIDASGTEGSVSLALNIDRTAPAVEIRTPENGLTTTASSIRVVAHVSDALSGVASATCNGREAHPDGLGGTVCVVSLMPGVNDVVVEASDRANNSGSAGIRVTRTGVSSSLQLEPEAFSLLVGQSKAVQILDSFHADVPDAAWSVSNSALGEISEDGRHVFTAKAPGIVTVTAIHGGSSATSEITIYAGDKLPFGSTRWRNSSLRVIETPPTGVQTSKPVDQYEQLVATAPGQRGLVTSIHLGTGRTDWIETPAMDDSEIVTSQRRHTIGGSLLVIEPRDGTGSVLARSAPPGSGQPWRYRSPGRFGDWIVQDLSGSFGIIETRPDRFPELVFFDGRTGRVTARGGFGSGVGIGLNIGCINGVNALREIPAEIGPTTIQADGSITFELLYIDDLEDFQQCDRVSGRLRRVLELVTITMAGPSIQSLRTYEAPAGSAPPVVTMFPVASDRHGGLLAPWRASLGTDVPVDSKIVHVTATGQQEYTLPVVGAVFVGATDLAVVSDGATVVSFDVMSGEVKQQHSYPEGVRILSHDNGTVMLEFGGKPGRFDQYGRPVPAK